MNTGSAAKNVASSIWKATIHSARPNHGQCPPAPASRTGTMERGSLPLVIGSGGKVRIPGAHALHRELIAQVAGASSPLRDECSLGCAISFGPACLFGGGLQIQVLRSEANAD
jgi:hypothetical protein